MRRLFILFLLVVLPLQFAVAAAAVYCLHETNIASNHVGHHEHEHQSTSAAAPDELPFQTTPSSDFGDPDCAYCHLSCAQPLTSMPPAWVALDNCARLRHELFSFTTRGPDGRDRPNWPLAS